MIPDEIKQVLPNCLQEELHRHPSTEQVCQATLLSRSAGALRCAAAGDGGEPTRMGSSTLAAGKPVGVSGCDDTVLDAIITQTAAT